MISQIKGKISNITEDTVTLEPGGSGLHYELLIPSGLYDRLKLKRDTGEEVTLHTLNYIEAGDRKSYHYPKMIGFTNLVDKEFFQLFTTVSGMGFKKGLKSLTMPIREIATAIETKEAALLVRLPGIGRRLAEKVIAELNGKMARFALSKTEQPLTSVHRENEDTFDETVAVLVQLQYNRSDAQEMVDKAMKSYPTVTATEELISIIFGQQAPKQRVVKR